MTGAFYTCRTIIISCTSHRSRYTIVTLSEDGVQNVKLAVFIGGLK